MNLGLTFHQQRGHTEPGPRFKVPGLVVLRVIHYTIAAPILLVYAIPGLLALRLIYVITNSNSCFVIRVIYDLSTLRV